MTRLARLIRSRGARGDGRAGDGCDLCGLAIPGEHRHVLELPDRRVRCACRACALLFERRESGGDRYRAIPDRCRLVEDFALDDARWQDLSIPVGLAYFLRDSRSGRTVAYYPGPMGATESLLGLDAWAALAAENPVLADLEPDVEALLVDRVGAARDHWLVPIDACFRLVAVLGSRWKGLAGGSEAWGAVRDFFEELRRRARPVDRTGRPARTA